jgi:hypothetical protein
MAPAGCMRTLSALLPSSVRVSICSSSVPFDAAGCTKRLVSPRPTSQPQEPFVQCISTMNQRQREFRIVLIHSPRNRSEEYAERCFMLSDSVQPVS